LVSPVYATSDGLKCYRAPNKVHAGNTMRSGFIIKSDYKSYGALIYRLQRKQPHKSTAISKDASSTAHLLVAWDAFAYKNLYADVLLVKCNKGYTWNEDELKELYYESRRWLKECNDITSDTWLVNDNMVLKTTSSAKYLKGNPELSISISEEEKDDCAMRPFCIHPER
jgi:hypothetical protein